MNDTTHRSRPAVRPFLAMAVVYAMWLGWLAYVAWINVQSGNQ